MNPLEIPDINLNKELKKCKSMEDLVDKNGLMQRLFGGIIQQFLEAEMEEHLGRERYERQIQEEKNYRNGYSPKKIKTSFGEVDVSVPRDRNAEFEPKIVRKYETVCNELDKKVIGLYARGMSVDDIHFKVRDEHRIVSKAAYICMALNMKGYKDILGIWVGEQEGAKF